MFSRYALHRGWYARPSLSGRGRPSVLIIHGGGLYYAHDRSGRPLPQLGQGIYLLTISNRLNDIREITGTTTFSLIWLQEP